jgi:hypothetical protein
MSSLYFWTHQLALAVCSNVGSIQCEWAYYIVQRQTTPLNPRRGIGQPWSMPFMFEALFWVLHCIHTGRTYVVQDGMQRSEPCVAAWCSTLLQLLFVSFRLQDSQRVQAQVRSVLSFLGFNFLLMHTMWKSVDYRTPMYAHGMVVAKRRLLPFPFLYSRIGADLPEAPKPIVREISVLNESAFFSLQLH